MPRCAESKQTNLPYDGNRILIIGPSWIGDAVMALPAAKALRSCYSDAYVCILSKQAARDVWELSGICDDMIALETGISGSIETVKELRARNFDRAYIIPNSFRTALLPYLARIPRRIGFRGHNRSVFLTEIVEAHAPDNDGNRHQIYEIGRILGAEPKRIDASLPLNLGLPESKVDKVFQKFNVHRGAIGLIPGAARGPAKCWPAEYYASLGRKIAEAGRNIIVFGGAGESGIAESIVSKIGANAVSLAGQTSVREWIALLQGCMAVVSNDSGGMHLAAALNVPLVSIFGITDPDKTGPVGTRCKVLQKSGLRQRKVPRDSDLARKCLESVRPEDVYNGLLEFINLNGKARETEK